MPLYKGEYMVAMNYSLPVLLFDRNVFPVWTLLSSVEWCKFRIYLNDENWIYFWRFKQLLYNCITRWTKIQPGIWISKEYYKQQKVQIIYIENILWIKWVCIPSQSRMCCSSMLKSFCFPSRFQKVTNLVELDQ